jgi:hypothetical protein
MPAPIVVFVDEPILQKLQAGLAGQAQNVPTAAAAAINKTLRYTRTRVTDEIRERITAKRGNIFKRISIEQASRKRLAGRVIIQARRIGLVNFQHTKSRRNGVKVTVFRGGPVYQFRHAFEATGASGNKQIFSEMIDRPKRRILNPHHEPNLGRLMHPLHAFYGLSLAAALRGVARHAADDQSRHPRQALQRDPEPDRPLQSRPAGGSLTNHAQRTQRQHDRVPDHRQGRGLGRVPARLQVGARLCAQDRGCGRWRSIHGLRHLRGDAAQGLPRQRAQVRRGRGGSREQGPGRHAQGPE